MDILFLFIGLILGGAAVWLISSFKHKSETGRIEERSSLLEKYNNELETKLTEEQQKAGGLTPELIRLSIGIENIDDITSSLDDALKIANK